VNLQEKLKPLLKIKEEEGSEEPESEDVALSTRIAKEAYRISLAITPESENMVVIALGLLSQAQAIVDKNSTLALRIYNRARIVARKR
jgi:hypothetical protein